MREQIAKALFDLMARDESVYFLTGDMGYNLVERFEEAYPDRFLNVGVAEQNLIGVAAGLCNTGFRPFVYSISNFLVHRCLEQVRNDVVLHDYPVVLLGTGAGFDNGPLGATHLMLDDIGVVRALAKLEIYCPGDVGYGEALPERLLKRGKPAYVRIPKISFRLADGRPDDVLLLPAKAPQVLLIAYGAMVEPCLQVANRYDHVSMLIMNRVYPFDQTLMHQVLNEHRRAIVVEDHFAPSGLFGMLCQFCMHEGLAVRLESLAPEEHYPLTIGKRDYLNQLNGLDVAGIERAVLRDTR